MPEGKMSKDEAELCVANALKQWSFKKMEIEKSI